MEQKPTFFIYKGETVVVRPGKSFPKLELIKRLNEMKFDVDSSFDKNLLISVYDTALSIDKKKLLIFNELKKDTEYYKSKNNFQKENIKDNNIFNNDNDFRKKYLFKDYFKNDNHLNNYEEEDSTSILSDSYDGHSSFCMKILK